MARATRLRLLTLPILMLILVRPGVPRAETITPEAPATRLALVLGNGDYRAGPLRTAANDAGLIAQSLAQAGFEVTAAANVDAPTLRATIDGFLTKAGTAGPDAVLVVYLSGYGLQLAGENYVVPVDASIVRDIDVPNQAVPLAELMRRLAAVPAKARVLVADLARKTPFAKVGAPLAPGLALVVPPAGVTVAFNAAPGTEAPADAMPYGAYARALAEMIQTPGLSLESVFIRARLRAGELTNGMAVPWTSGTPGGATPSPALAGVGQGMAAGSEVTASIAYSALIAADTLADDLSFLKSFPTDALAPRVRDMAAIRREATIWNDSVRAGNARAFWTYMRRYPRGPHYADARRCLVRLQAQLEPPPRFDIVAYDDVAPPPPGEADLLDAIGDAKGPAIPRPPVSLVPLQRGAYSDDMVPPPLVPTGMLPVPMPIALPEGARAIGAPGTITQPGVAAEGPVVVTGTVEASGSALAVTGRNGLLSKSVESFGAVHAIVQTDPAGAIISRTEVASDRAGVTIVQTGPGGGIVLKLVTQVKPGGGRSTIATTGNNEILSIVLRDDQDIVTVVKPGPASTRALNPVYRPAGPGQRPLLLRPTLPAPDPVEAPVASEAPAMPLPPPPLALPPLPVAQGPAPSPQGDASKSTAAVAGSQGTGAKSDAAAARPADGPTPSAPEPPKQTSAAPAAATSSVSPSTGEAVPQPPRRPDAIEPTRGGRTAAKAALHTRAAPLRTRAPRSRPAAKRRR